MGIFRVKAILVVVRNEDGGDVLKLDVSISNPSEAPLHIVCEGQLQFLPVLRQDELLFQLEYNRFTQERFHQVNIEILATLVVGLMRYAVTSFTFVSHVGSLLYPR